MKRVTFTTLLVCLLVTSCAGETTSAPTASSDPKPIIVQNPTLTSTLFATPSPIPTERLSVAPFITLPVDTSTPTPVTTALDPNDWKNWSIIPSFIDPSLQKVYERGLSLGNDPHAFSIFGDCQTRPGEFLGIFETDPSSLQGLPPELRETVVHFKGSFNREAATTQDGTTPGALLWAQWHRGEFGCTFVETPVACELRTHRPSFVLIQVGTHFESRNTEYLRKIINQLLDAGVVPILATKADNRELDERVNRDMALLAAEYDLPLWNFWAAVSDLPNRGLYTRPDRPLQGDIYLIEEAAQRHRMTGLEALDAVWRAIVSRRWN